MNFNKKIVIASGKGGTGKTTVAVNLFYAIRDFYNIPAQLIDCDVEEPNVNIFTKGILKEEKDVNIKIPVIDTDKCTYCGLCAEYCAYNAIVFVESMKHIAVMEDICKGCGACSYACKFDAITEKDYNLGKVQKFSIDNNSELVEGRLNIGSPFAVPVIKFAKKQENKNSLIIMDAPPGTSCPVIQTIDDADYIILVAEPTPFGLNDLKLMIETVKLVSKKIGVVINKAGIGSDEIYSYLKAENIEILMEIPFDKEIAKLYSDGKIIVKEKPEIKQMYIDMFEKIK